ncbi:hypothetical protein NKR23_g1380 [Pleurostoma richardsiae]|jgi:uncharacterized membrane protein|uniref:MARVEL domain-containing protein n=1 Tax=Pleurostoma richardsiae TaxID=41990 RepID=A0AA38SB08_9PEZI|nr:hypothetical protein NKR23_g1380 [Pleurostoma richardsiae]
MDAIQLIVRALQLLWTLLITALIGNVIASNINGQMGSINFAMFVAALSWVAALYGLVAAFVESIAIPIVLLALDGLSTLFTLIAGIVLAAKLHAANCGGNLQDHYGSGWIGFGSANDEKRCREIQASTAFMWFLFACFAVGVFFTFMGFRRGGASVRSGGPHMSQVRV